MIDNILSIAREMMRADGVAALSLNGIARRLGMTPPALYTYFDSKHAIYDALFKIGFEEFGRRMRGPTLEKESPYEHLKAVFEEYDGLCPGKSRSLPINDAETDPRLRAVCGEHGGQFK